MKTLNTASTTYEDVGRQQVYLTRDQEITLVDRYKVVKEEWCRYMLQRGKCRLHFLDRYSRTKKEGKSVAKLSADYNPRKAGLNKSIEQKFGLALDPARVRLKSTRVGHSLADVLFNLNLSEAVYQDMATRLIPTAKLKALEEEIAEIEDTLYRSMLMAGSEIAKNHASRLLGIDEADATQQVGVYLLDSIRRYDPDYRTDKGNRVKLCTYAYNRSEKLIKEWVLTNSRLVRIPRSKMERILIVVRAYDIMDTHIINLTELVDVSNKIVKQRSGKLTLTTAFDIDEVDDLIKILLSTYIHLDKPYNRSNRANQLTIGDMLVNEAPCVIDTIEEHDRREQLYEVMHDHLTEREFQIIMLRYFHDPTDKVPRALTEVGALLVSVYGGTDYSRESIRLLEKSALAKLQDVEEIRELWMD